MGVSRSVKEQAILLCEEKLETFEEIKVMLDGKYPSIEALVQKEISQAYTTLEVLDSLKIAK